MKKPGQLTIVYRSMDELDKYENNARTHSAAQVEQIRESLRQFGWTNPVLIADGGILAGHGRIEAATGMWAVGENIGRCPRPFEVPTVDLSDLDVTQRRAYVLADNQLALNAGWDTDLLMAELTDLKDDGFDLSVIGFSDAELRELFTELGGPSLSGAGSLVERFMVPPFSTLDARAGWWKKRKDAWMALGLRSEVGRDAPAYGDASERQSAESGTTAQHRTSVFDPVLCELAYQWFCPVGGIVLDPFAGGSVRGIVAARLGRRYVGMDLRDEQVQANLTQLDLLVAEDIAPEWHVGDSRQIAATLQGIEADFLFSCPPYADLERYSDHPADLSTMKYPDFLVGYHEIIAGAVSLLRPDRFACFVVGDIRSRSGAYRNFVSDTISAFLDAGLTLYNEAILLTAFGSAPIRAGKQFASSRKLCKVHQNVLVFVKGDWKKAVAACGDVDVSNDLFPQPDE